MDDCIADTDSVALPENDPVIDSRENSTESVNSSDGEATFDSDCDRSSDCDADSVVFPDLEAEYSDVRVRVMRRLMVAVLIEVLENEGVGVSTSAQTGEAASAHSRRT